MESHFRKVIEFNFQFGVLESTDLSPKIGARTENPQLVQNCLKLIREEFTELKTAVEEWNLLETIDGLADLLYVAYGMACRLGVNLGLYGPPLDGLFLPSWVPNETVRRIGVGIEKIEIWATNITEPFESLKDILKNIVMMCYGFSRWLKVNMDEVFDEVHRNNMSKLCLTEQEARDTVEWYRSNPQFGFDSPYYRLTPDSKKYVVCNSTTGKVLKSIRYTPVNLRRFLPSN
jgi:predicted HAD superfamily Cof-like phosphohydrolase